jgi:hypothetical protein
MEVWPIRHRKVTEGVQTFAFAALTVQKAAILTAAFLLHAG